MPWQKLGLLEVFIQSLFLQLMEYSPDLAERKRNLRRKQKDGLKAKEAPEPVSHRVLAAEEKQKEKDKADQLQFASVAEKGTSER